MDSKSELLTFLESLGFKGPELTAAITTMLDEFPQSKKIRHLILHGEEQMRFTLHFEHDRQFDAYRLVSYNATYRKAIHIKQDQYQGVDIAGLEAQMAAVDWKAWFSLGETLPEAVRASSVYQTLDQLASAEAAEGTELRDRLRYKYFPPETLDPNLRRSMTAEFERERTFHASGAGIVNTNLAYHILNGNLEQLHATLLQTELEAFMDVDLYSLLCIHLSLSPAQFYIDCARFKEGVTIAFSIHVHNVNGRYEPDWNIVTFKPAEPIFHKKIGHVDTKALEEQMASIDWQSPGIYQLSNDNVQLNATIEKVDRMLTFLDQTNNGKKIAAQLRRKYWSAAPFFEAFVTAKDADTKEITAEFPLDVPARSIYNLLCGRAVIAHPLGTLREEHRDWLRLTTTEGAAARFTTIQDGLSRADLIHLLTTLLHIKPEQETINALLQGERVKISAPTLEGYRRLQLEALPEHRNLQVLDESGAIIPVNFHLQTEAELKSDNKNCKQQRHNRGLNL